MQNLIEGDLISWVYIHHFNSRSRAPRMRHGEFISKVKHKNTYTGQQLAVVKFQGNKGRTRVPLFELQEMSQRRQKLIAAQKNIYETF